MAMTTVERIAACREQLTRMRATEAAALQEALRVDPGAYSPSTRPDDCYDVIDESTFALAASISYQDAAKLATAWNSFPRMLNTAEKLLSAIERDFADWREPPLLTDVEHLLGIDTPQ